MDVVQNIFYTLGSIYMLLGIFFLIFLIFVVWKAYQGVVKAQKSIEELKDNVEEKVSDFVASRPARFAQVMGGGLAAFIIRKIKDAMNEKKKA